MKQPGTIGRAAWFPITSAPEQRAVTGAGDVCVHVEYSVDLLLSQVSAVSVGVVAADLGAQIELENLRIADPCHPLPDDRRLLRARVEARRLKDTMVPHSLE